MTEDKTLWSRWNRLAERAPDAVCMTLLRAGCDSATLTRAGLIARAEQYAAWLHAQGVTAGDSCAIVLRHHIELYPLYLGLVCLGAVPSILAYPNARLHPDKFRAGLSGMARRSGLKLILTERELEPTLLPLLESTPVAGLRFPLEASLGERWRAPAAVSGDAPALLQHSSGTTGLQKAVLLSNRAVLRHVDDYARALEVSASDRVVSWLPLYHDMGLIAAFHLPLALGLPSLQLDPIEWVSAPILWVEAMAREHGTLSWLPNFAYALMGARLHDEDLEGLSLAHVRMVINCSEPVRHESQQALLAKLAPIGLRVSALSASYAMAETTFAVTQTPPGRAAAMLTLDRTRLSSGYVEPAAGSERVCVSSGAPLPDCEVKVLAADGSRLAQDRVGELYVRSPALFDGYHNDPGLSESVLQEGFYRTGDTGFVHAGEVFVVGRKKDLIIVAGRNLYPEDIEAAVSEVPGVLPGRVVAFGRADATLGTERVCVIVESALTAAEHARLRAEVIAAGQRIDVTINEAHVVAPRWLIKSSSGKLSRSDNRERLSQLQAERTA